MLVLNLVINGLPSILKLELELVVKVFSVLNLVINGLPSIPHKPYTVEKNNIYEEF